MDAKLTQLVKAARGVKLTEAQIEEQRINFAYGNAGEGDEGTQEAVRAAATILRNTEKKAS
jgi:hypothetical protein